MGAVHQLVLDGAAPELARHYPPALRALGRRRARDRRTRVNP
jgi:hypothetical protein